MSKYALLRHAPRLAGMKILAAMLLVVNNANAAGSEVIPDEYNLCTPRGFTVGFFNGVANTLDDARNSLEEVKKLIGAVHNGEPVEYEVFYNDTGSTHGKTFFEDIAEVFAERGKMIDQSGKLGTHMEYAWEVASPGEKSYLERLLGVMGEEPLSILDVFLRDYVSKAVAGIAMYASNPPTGLNHAEHRASIDRLATEGQKLLFIAHSQGNMFVDKAFAYAKTKYRTNSVNVVHVAPPYNSLRGPYLLADIDLIINGLNVFGWSTVPDANMNLPFSRKDPSGHGFRETYLDPDRLSRAWIQKLAVTALDYMESPVAKGHKGFFTTTLTWDGQGDVDLHTYEPGGSHVFYLKMQGEAGALDVDNRKANGPEHYYASCDARELQGGAYIIGVNNFKGADGRKATVHVSFARGGQPVTREIMLDPQRGRNGDDSPQLLMNLFVSREASGKWKVVPAG